MGIITLTTDFGTNDWFVGTMKGVILRISPTAQIVDITHNIPFADIRAAAFSLLSSYHYFPAGTVNVVVVDPGVGSIRRPVAVKTQNYFFVAPDNGVLSYALEREKIIEIREIANPEYHLKPLGNTFHGRDIFAPVSAHLSNGIAVEKLGPKLNDIVRLAPIEHHKKGKTIEGSIVYIDRFGNAITSIPFGDPDEFLEKKIYIRGKQIAPVLRCYADVKKGEPVAVPGSTGFMEIAVREASAHRKFKLKVGMKVIIK